MTDPKGPDSLDAAIAAAAAQDMMMTTIGIEATGRVVQLTYPPDLDTIEIAELAGWMLTMLRAQCEARRAARPRLLIARGSLPAADA